jgi:hypothetical protein
VQPGGAAEGEQGVVAGVHAAPHGRHPHAVRHAGVDEGVDAGGAIHHPHAEAFRQPGHGALRRPAVERLAPAQEIAGVEQAEHEVGVRHRGLGAAGAVAGGAGDRAGAARAHLERAAWAEMRDRAAAGAECHDVEAVQRDALARHVAPAAERGLAFRDQRDVGGGAAHVEGDEVGGDAARGQRHRRRDAAGGAGERGADREPRRLGHRSHAAMAQDHEESAAVARLFQPRREAVEIAPHHRRDVGVHGGGAEALEFLDLRQDVGREGDVEAGQRGAERGGGFPLVPGVAPGVEKADRDGLHRLLAQGGDRAVQRARVEREQRGAVRAQPLAHRQAQAARHQRLGRRHPHVVALGLQPFAHLDHVAVALRGEHGDARAAALQQRVGGDRGAVDDARGAPEQPGERQAERGGEVLQAGEHAFALVVRRAGGLGERLDAVGRDAEHVGEGAADIDADAVLPGRIAAHA